MTRATICAWIALGALAAPASAQPSTDTAGPRPTDAEPPAESTDAVRTPSGPGRTDAASEQHEVSRSAPTGTVHPWGIGLAFHPLALPGGHVGIPLTGDQSGFHLAAAVELRYQIDDDSAVDVGLGLPTSSAGIGVWVGYERLTPLYVEGETLRLELFVTPGLQLGFAGPDYFARQRDVFVGYDYVYGGPAAFGVRFPSGLRLSLARSSFDITASAVPQLLFTPSVEVLFTISLGLLARF